MAPIVSPTGGAVLVRKLANLSPTSSIAGQVNLLNAVSCSHGCHVQQFPCMRSSVDSVPCREVFVGDVVLLKDPEKSGNFVIRRLAALEGYEMVSNDEKDEPFVLEKDQCWVLADNLVLKPKEARDSRLFGPVPMTDILGRVIYSLRTAVDHGLVENSGMATKLDGPVLAVELDVEELAKNNKA
ncbi:uncharacterized protein [Zea mays]|nr:uncharacterized protein LOC100193542 isoform X3 [Zea mays]|eukprot:XP_020402991.1 peptidase S24/S26A/S26B/S26C family protein isoform X3 [Zea mays]